MGDVIEAARAAIAAGLTGRARLEAHEAAVAEASAERVARMQAQGLRARVLEPETKPVPRAAPAPKLTPTPVPTQLTSSERASLEAAGYNVDILGPATISYMRETGLILGVREAYEAPAPPIGAAGWAREILTAGAAVTPRNIPELKAEYAQMEWEAEQLRDVQALSTFREAEREGFVEVDGQRMAEEQYLEYVRSQPLLVHPETGVPYTEERFVEESLTKTSPWTLGAEAFIPGVYTARHWGEMQTGMKAGMIALDVATMLPVVGFLGRAGAMGIRPLAVAGRLATAPITLPIQMVKHPIRTARGLASITVAPIIHPRATLAGIGKLAISPFRKAPAVTPMVRPPVGRAALEPFRPSAEVPRGIVGERPLGVREWQPPKGVVELTGMPIYGETFPERGVFYGAPRITQTLGPLGRPPRRMMVFGAGEMMGWRPGRLGIRPLEEIWRPRGRIFGEFPYAAETMLYGRPEPTLRPFGRELVPVRARPGARLGGVGTRERTFEELARGMTREQAERLFMIPSEELTWAVAPSGVPSIWEVLGIRPTVRPGVLPWVVPRVSPAVRPGVAPAILPAVRPFVSPISELAAREITEPYVIPALRPYVVPAPAPVVPPYVPPSVVGVVPPIVPPEVPPPPVPPIIFPLPGVGLPAGRVPESKRRRKLFEEKFWRMPGFEITIQNPYTGEVYARAGYKPRRFEYGGKRYEPQILRVKQREGSGIGKTFKPIMGRV